MGKLPMAFNIINGSRSGCRKFLYVRFSGNYSIVILNAVTPDAAGVQRSARVVFLRSKISRAGPASNRAERGSWRVARIFVVADGNINGRVLPAPTLIYCTNYHTVILNAVKNLILRFLHKTEFSTIYFGMLERCPLCIIIKLRRGSHQFPVHFGTGNPPHYCYIKYPLGVRMRKILIIW